MVTGNIIRFFNDYVLETIFPRRCFGCGKEGFVLCEPCIGEFPPAPAGSGEVIAYAPFSYRHPALKKALWSLKFKGAREIARICAALLYDRIIPLLEEYGSYRGVRYPLLVPVPISRRRKWKRGYNQAELIARELARLDDGVSFELSCSALQRIKDAPPQTTLREKTMRIKNIQGCFAVTQSEVARLHGRDVIVLDDIFTTGATFDEAKRTLKAAGVRIVICIAVAH